MDTFVPSPGLMGSPFVNSPQFSIYDQDRSDLSTFCGSTMSFSNTGIDALSTDDMGSLDGNLEDSNLQNVLTPDMINILQQNMQNPSNGFDWSGKMTQNAPLPADNLGSNPTLAQLNMEPDVSLLNDVLMEQDDVKSSYSDLLYSEASSTMNPLSNISAVSSSTDSTYVSSDSKCIETLSNVTSNYMRNCTPIKSNFPPRSSQPQLIGIVPPLKKQDMKDTIATIKQENELTELKSKSLKAQSPNLHKLLCNESRIKPEIIGSGISKVSNSQDHQAQIVPTSMAPKRTHSGLIKLEPVSPKPEKSMVKDESVEEKWKDIENFIHNPGQEQQAVRKRRRYDSGSSSHISDDEDDEDGASSYGGKYGDDDSDDDYSDIDADLANICPTECESLVTLGKKQKQYFWQYNVQSKGPKGTRLKLSVEAPSDPHVLNDFEDPVFDECNTSVAGIRHGGKARKGDGNEISPNPKKLFMIGHQLMRLNRQINACQLGPDVPAVKRNESRKEKNKLASRACRLKKKAQHEANKIKLYGMEQEHSQLNHVLQSMWPHIRDRARALLGQTDKTDAMTAPSESLRSKMDGVVTENLKSMIGGHTTEYVNSVILKVESGDSSGGLDIRKRRRI